MVFEWDENKRQSNILKHRIDFIDAKIVFKDPCKIDMIDTRVDYGEVRSRTVGRMGDTLVLTVVSTDRNGTIRIISARQANKKERSIYYGNC